MADPAFILPISISKDAEALRQAKEISEAARHGFPEDLNLYLVHCGYYDAKIGDGLFENHYNFFVVATDYDAAKALAKAEPLYREKKMHIDGLQRIDAVSGYRIQMKNDRELDGKTVIINNKFRGLAPKKV